MSIQPAPPVSSLTQTKWSKPEYTLPTPSLTFLFRLECDMESFHSIGQGPYGNRSTVIFKGGRFEGPSLRGEILPGGGDWEIVRDHTDPDGTEKQTAHLNTRYNLKTHDGAYIYLQTTGTRTGDRSVLTDLGSGGHSAEEFRMRLILTAETDQNNAKYSWLNQSVIIASAGREGDMVIYDAYQVV